MAQSLFSGWALFGIVLISALAANIALSIALHGQGMNSYLAGAAALHGSDSCDLFYLDISRKPLDQ